MPRRDPAQLFVGQMELVSQVADNVPSNGEGQSNDDQR